MCTICKFREWIPGNLHSIALISRVQVAQVTCILHSGNGDSRESSERRTPTSALINSTFSWFNNYITFKSFFYYEKSRRGIKGYGSLTSPGSCCYSAVQLHVEIIKTSVWFPTSYFETTTDRNKLTRYLPPSKAAPSIDINHILVAHILLKL